jgi:anti-sigma B factor antagonist
MSASLQDGTGFELAPVVWLGSRQSPGATLASYLSEQADVNFKVSTVRRPGTAVLVLEGELDMATVGDFDSAVGQLESETAGTIVVDLSRLRFLDCSGLHSFVAARQRIAAAGGTLKLVPGPQHVRRLFALTRVDTLFEFVEDRAGIL